MSSKIPIANRRGLREAGFDEYWLQDQIYENPICLGLGDLEALARERRQSSGGRLDLLLKNPDDDTMYEVELMLGETDESHIVRTIEYWDNEKRRWPQRQHIAVLVAESINRRFFNVIHLLSHSIPIVAIQAALLDTDNGPTLYFTKVLDTFEEVDDGTTLDAQVHDRDYWVQKSQWTLENAESLLELVGDLLQEPRLNHLKNYVAISVNGYNYLRLHKRSMNKSLLSFRIAPALQEEAALLLDGANLSFTKKPKRFSLTIDGAMISRNPEVFKRIAELARDSMEADG